jgi:hypothetical protein
MVFEWARLVFLGDRNSMMLRFVAVVNYAFPVANLYFRGYLPSLSALLYSFIDDFLVGRNLYEMGGQRIQQSLDFTSTSTTLLNQRNIVIV